MKKVLIITYYWPPGGGSGVQRCLKFARYLRDEKWEPVIFTVKNGNYSLLDPSLEKEVPDETEVIRMPYWEPHHLYNKLIGRGKKFTNVGFIAHGKNGSLLEKLGIWIRGNLFIPDARKFWIRPSVRFLRKYLRDNPVDLIFSSGPPHSAHLIALRVKEALKIPWVADFRDSWTGVFYYSQMMVSSWADRKNRRLEKQCLDKADHVVTVGETMKRDYEKLTATTVDVITNGYDHTDYENVRTGPVTSFSIVHTGMFFCDRNPVELWEVLGEMADKDPGFRKDLQIKLIGKTDEIVIESIKKNGLMDNLILKDYLPHAEIPAIQKQAGLLLLAINRVEQASSVLTGKVFEYLAAGRPILAFCPPDSDVDRIVRETKTGWTIGFNQKPELRECVAELYKKFKNNNLFVKPENIEQYSRKALTRKLAGIFDRLIHLPAD